MKHLVVPGQFGLQVAVGAAAWGLSASAWAQAPTEATPSSESTPPPNTTAGTSGTTMAEASLAGSEGATSLGAVNDDGAEAAREPLLPPPSRGFEYGLRTGVALPFGDADGGGFQRSGSMAGIVGVRVPVWLDLGYRLDSEWWLGFAAQLGLGSAGEDCPDAAECEWSDLRLAAQAIYSWGRDHSTSPWLGLGLGWESLRGSITIAVPGDVVGQDMDIAVRARELLGGPQLILQGGMQFDLGEALTVGPYASASAGMFLTDSYDCIEQIECPDGGSVDEKAVHAWIGLGVRGTHGP